MNQDCAICARLRKAYQEARRLHDISADPWVATTLRLRDEALKSLREHEQTHESAKAAE